MPFFTEKLGPTPESIGAAALRDYVQSVIGKRNTVGADELNKMLVAYYERAGSTPMPGAAIAAMKQFGFLVQQDERTYRVINDSAKR